MFSMFDYATFIVCYVTFNIKHTLKHTLAKKGNAPTRFFIFVALIRKRIKIRKPETEFREILFLPFSINYFFSFICIVKQRPLSKSIFANLISVLYFACFHFHCAASLILTLTVPWVTRVKIGIGQNRVRQLNDLILLFFRATSCHWWPMYLVDSKSSEFVVKVSAGTIFSSCIIKIVWLRASDRATLPVHFYFSLAASGSIVTNSNLQISEDIALIPSFSMFSS